MQTMPTQSMSLLSVWLDPRIERPNGQPVSLMTHLFDRMDGLFPGRWRMNYPSVEAMQAWEDAWSEGFVEDRVDPRELREGITNCRRMFDRPPSYKEFLRACRPYTDPEVAYREAVDGLVARREGCRGIWTHPAIYWATVRVGQHDMLQSSWMVVKGRWEAALLAELGKGEWASIPMPTQALPAPGATVTDMQEGARRVEAMARQAASVRGIDPLAWAKRMLESPKGKITPAKLDMARRALGQQAL